MEDREADVNHTTADSRLHELTELNGMNCGRSQAASMIHSACHSAMFIPPHVLRGYFRLQANSIQGARISNSGITRR